MPRRVRAALVATLVVLFVAVGAEVGLRAWDAAHRTDLQAAMALAPAGSQRFSFTDWAGVRRVLGADLDAGSPTDSLASFLDDAFDRDLSSTSAMLTSAGPLQERLGFSPASAQWELLAQGTAGAAVIVRLPDDTDLSAVTDAWEAAGYQRPAEGDDAGEVWLGGPEVVAGVGGGVTVSPEFQYLGLDAERHLVVASDSAAYADVASRAARGDGYLGDGLDDVVDAVGDPLTAAVYTGDYTCRALTMSQADESDQAEADALQAQAGDVDPLTGFAMGTQASGAILVAMGLETDGQARTNADTRATLASGPAVGQGGDFSDRFRLRQASAQGSVVVLDLAPEPRTFVLSDLSSGPVLYATC